MECNEGCSAPATPILLKQKEMPLWWHECKEIRLFI